MGDFIEAFDEANPVPLVLEYGAMQFAFIMFANYGGVGIDSAEWIAENWEEYLPIYEKLHELTDWYELQRKKAENLKQRWGAMSQGYFLTILEGNDEDTLDPGTAASNEPAEEAAEEK